jgi:hypothetical protein
MALKTAPSPADDRRARRRARRRLRLRRWSARLQMAVATGLAAVLAVLLNLLAVRLDVTWRLPGRPDRLSPQTEALLASTHGTITATVLAPRSHEAFEPLRQLLQNLRLAARAAGGATLEVVCIDPYRDLAAAAQLARRVGVAGWAVILESEGRRETVPLAEMFDPPFPPAGNADGGDGAAPRGRRFLGEQLCVTAITRLSRPPAVIHALAGHGERDFEDYDPLTGYSDLAREIRREGHELRRLNISVAGHVPADCDVLVIAGPRHPPSAEEQGRLEEYLTGGGRLLLLVDRSDVLPSGWERLMARLGLRFAGFSVVGAGLPPGHVLTVERFGTHPVARALRNTAVHFANPQVIDIEGPGEEAAADQPRADVVVAAPEDAWGETNPDLFPRRFDPGVDRKGLLPLVVAVERGAASGADVGIRPSRAVVFGDSHCAANALLAGGRTGNRDLLLNAVNWLADGGLPAAPAAVPADGGLLRQRLSRRGQLRFLRRSLIFWPCSLALLGALCVAVRRR